MKKVLALFVGILLVGATSLDPGRFPIEVGDLADGTDGEIVTWDSSGVAVCFGPGTADQYVASQGAGAEPIFKSILDEDDMSSDSATDVASQQSIKKYVDDNAVATKEFLTLPHEQQTALDDWIYDTAPDTATSLFLFIVPNDFASLTDAVVVIIPDATETAQWDLDASVAAVGEDYNSDTRQTLNETQAVTVNDLTDLDISASLTGLAANDYVAVRFVSNTSTLRVIALRIRYN